MHALTQPRMLAAAGLLLLAAGLLWGAFRDEKPERLPPDWRPVNDRLAASVGEHEGSNAGSTGAAPSSAGGGTGGGSASGGGSDAGSDAAVPDTGSAAGDAAGETSGTEGGSGAAPNAGSDAAAGPVPDDAAGHGPASGGAAGTASGHAAGASPDAASGSAPGAGGFDINRATEAEWDELPGIGPAKARAIVEDRERNGPFRSVDDLLRVKGIGPKLLERIKDAIAARNASGG